MSALKSQNTPNLSVFQPALNLLKSTEVVDTATLNIITGSASFYQRHKVMNRVLIKHGLPYQVKKVRGGWTLAERENEIPNEFVTA